MQKLFSALALVVALGSPLASAAVEPASDYTKLLAVLQSGNTRIDYQQLRIDYMESPEYKQAKDTSAAETAMVSELNAKDYAKALEHAEEVLASEYVNLDAHFVAFIANRELGAAEKAEFHRTVFRGLLDSIHNSGDGLTLETAWVVIKVHEEYVLLRALGMQPGTQSVVHKNGHSYDEMKVKDENGKEHTFYFNVDIPFKHYGV